MVVETKYLSESLMITHSSFHMNKEVGFMETNHGSVVPPEISTISPSSIPYNAVHHHLVCWLWRLPLCLLALILRSWSPLRFWFLSLFGERFHSGYK